MLVLVVGHHAAAQRAFRVQHAAGVDLRAVVVPRAGAGHHGGGIRFQRPLAHQVDRAARIAAALQQAGRTAQHLDAVVHRRAAAEIAGAAVHAAVQRDAVVLHGGQVEAARVDVLAALRALLQRHAGGAGQRVVDGGQHLLVEQLAGDHADRLGNVLQRLFALAHRDRAGRVGAAAFGGGAAQLFRRHRHRRHRLRRGIVARHRADRYHRAVDVGRQAAAGQQHLQRIARRHAAGHCRRGLAGHQRRLHHQFEPGLARQRVERPCQRLGTDVDVNGNRGLGVSSGRNECEGDGRGKRDEVGTETGHAISREV